MSNDFRIILENTFKFKEGKLYLMLIREKDVFAVEVVDRTKTFGRKYVSNRSQANLLFDEISNSLIRFKRLPEAEEIIKRAFSLKSTTKILFVLMTYNRTLTQKDIGKISKKINFKLSMKTGFRKDVADENGLTIYIYETLKEKKPFGILVGSANAKDLRFELF